MTPALAVPIRMLATAGALGLTPYLLVRALRPRLSLAPTVAVAGMVAVCINTGICIIFHAVGIPLTPTLLACAHAALLGGAAITWRRRSPRRAPTTSAEEKRLVALFLLLALLVLPVTHLTGIDTYKWQDLATAAAIEQSIPWLVHPLALYGFAVRSYPSAHPLCLATIQILTGLGVDGGMYLMSVMVGILGLATSFWLGTAIVPGAPSRGPYALWFAFLYVFSPVFMRYTYWATGRGLFLAVLPLFLLALLHLPKATAWSGLLLAGIMLPMTHKTGGIAILLVATASCLTPACRLITTRRRLVLATLPFALAAVALSPSLLLSWPFGTPAGLTRQAISRFAWYLPVAVAGLVAVPGWWQESPRRRLLAPLLLSLPLAFTEEMYGAMIALPFAVAATARGVQLAINTWLPANKFVPRTLIALTLVAALVIVVHRAIPATPRRVRDAAAFIEKGDPLGPFSIVAPGSARPQMQAYLSGCPRFALAASGRTHMRFSEEPFPTHHDNLQDTIRDMIQYLRHSVKVTGIEGNAYSRPARTYYVTIDGEGHPPAADAPLLYDRDGIRIYRTGKAAVEPVPQ